MNSKLQVAVVGCGRMGKVRAKAAIAYGATVRYVCDPNGELADELSAEIPDCKSLDSADAIDWKQLDAVFVCTPPSERGKVELRAIEHGVPFLVEKPAGLSVDAVVKIQKALEAKPLLTAVGYMNRYRRSVQMLKERTANKTILGMSADWLVGMYGVPWWSEKAGSGGPVNEQATHLIDLARYLVGEIDLVQAVAQPMSDRPELIGSASINLRFIGGQTCSMLYSCLAKEKMIRLHVYMDDGDVVLSGWDFRLADDDSTAVAYEDRNDIFFEESRAFLADVESKQGRVLSSFADAMVTQRVVDAIHQAVESGESEAVEVPSCIS